VLEFAVVTSQNGWWSVFFALSTCHYPVKRVINTI